jgi:hypothetical protein
MLMEIRRPFAGRERTFKLRFGEASELERLCDAGIGAIMVRLATHQFTVADVREAVRMGLQGGGASEPEATALVMRNVDENPLAQHIELAADIIGAYVNGIPDPVKKKDGAADQTPPSPPETSVTGTASAG